MDIAKRTQEILMDCLYKPEEVADGVPPKDSVIVDGVLHKFALHPARVESHKAEIAELINELPPAFHKSNGGGWSFLNLCVDKNEVQWGEHRNCEELLVLAIATKQGGLLTPREMWPILPGGLPYVWLGE